MVLTAVQHHSTVKKARHGKAVCVFLSSFVGTGVIEPGTKINEMMAHQDWLPTLMAAAGVPDVKEKLAKGYKANGKDWRVHIDGYNFMPYFQGKEEKGPRESLLYFTANGELNAVRWNDWKLHFATLEGNITDAVRFAPNW